MNIYVPSLKKEYTNRSLTVEIIGFSAIICLLIVPIFVILGQDLLKDNFKVLFTYISLNRSFVLFSVINILFITALGSVSRYINKMTTAYIIDKDTIVKANLKSDKRILKINKLIYQGYSIVTIQSTDLDNIEIKNNLFTFYKIIKARVQLNQQLNFVEAFINTDLYDKTTFSNTKLKSENKKRLIYSTDFGELKIPNFYSNEDRRKDNSFNKYFYRRIALWAFTIVMIFNFLSWYDLYHHSKIDDEYIAIMQEVNNKIANNVTKYSFTQVLQFQQTDYYPVNTNTIFEFDEDRLSYFIYKEGLVLAKSISYYHNNYETYIVEKFGNIMMTLDANFLKENYDVDTFIDKYNLQTTVNNLLKIQKGEMESHEFNIFGYDIIMERKDNKILVYTK